VPVPDSHQVSPRSLPSYHYSPVATSPAVPDIVPVGFSVPSVAVVGWQVTWAIGWPGPGPATGTDLAIAWRCHCIGGKRQATGFKH
jgi:hypothetical protein